MNLLSVKGFLQVGGVVLLVLGILGLFAFNTPNGIFYLSTAENVAHIVLGVVALAASFWFPANVNKWLVVAVGLFALLAGIWGFFTPNFLGASLQTSDNILHLVVGVWALWASRTEIE